MPRTTEHLRPDVAKMRTKLQVLELFRGSDERIRWKELCSRALKNRSVSLPSLRVRIGDFIQRGIAKVIVDPYHLHNPIIELVNPSERELIARDVGEFFQRAVYSSEPGKGYDEQGSELDSFLFSTIDQRNLRRFLKSEQGLEITRAQRIIFGALWVIATKQALEDSNKSDASLIAKSEGMILRLALDLSYLQLKSYFKPIFEEAFGSVLSSVFEQILASEWQARRGTETWLSIHTATPRIPSIIATKEEIDKLEMATYKFFEHFAATLLISLAALRCRQIEKVLATGDDLNEFIFSMRSQLQIQEKEIAQLSSIVKKLQEPRVRLAVSELYERRNSLSIVFLTGHIGSISKDVDKPGWIPASRGWKEEAGNFLQKKSLESLLRALGMRHLKPIAEIAGLDSAKLEILKKIGNGLTLPLWQGNREHRKGHKNRELCFFLTKSQKYSEHGDDNVGEEGKEELISYYTFFHDTETLILNTASSVEAAVD
jgi:hypothetical protein